MKLGFTRSEANPNLYFKVEDDKPLILVLYVDDLFLTSANPLIHKCKREMASEFEMNDQGLEVWQKPRLWLHKDGTYIRWMLRPCSCMVLSKKRSMWRNLKDLRFMIENLMYAG